MGCWTSREKYEVTREWGGQVGFKYCRAGGKGGWEVHSEHLSITDLTLWMELICKV